MKQANRFTTEGAHPRVITDGFDLAQKEALKVCLLSGFFFFDPFLLLTFSLGCVVP